VSIQIPGLCASALVEVGTTLDQVSYPYFLTPLVNPNEPSHVLPVLGDCNSCIISMDLIPSQGETSSPPLSFLKRTRICYLYHMMATLRRLF
jgi:hypothetical protein